MPKPNRLPKLPCQDCDHLHITDGGVSYCTIDIAHPRRMDAFPESCKFRRARPERKDEAS